MKKWSFPGLNGTVLALLDEGTLVEYNNGEAYADGQEWVHVRYGSIEGYVSKDYVTFKI
ncbi:SH3 domain-containing protein [Clostridium botulinum]|uniref:SH3 domain-containing protein n=1 Tax=Clostridium botulinum TaxID=1491 RepID=UPI003A810080